VYAADVAEWNAEVTAKCGSGALNSAYTQKSLLQTGLISIGFGAYYGLVFQGFKFNGQRGLEKPASNLKKTFQRLLVFAILTLPGGVFYLLNFAGIQSETILLVFAQILPIFLLMFVPFAYSDELCKRYGLLTNAEYP